MSAGGRPRAVRLDPEPIFELAVRRRRGYARIRETGVNLARVEKYGPTVWEADRLAVALGEHPSAVWGPEWEQAS